MSDYPGREPLRDPTNQDERLEIMRRPETWPPRAFGLRAQRGCAMVNVKTGQHGLLTNVPWRDRLTVYETGVFDHTNMNRIYNTEDPSGVPEHPYESFDAMYDAGWRPD